VNKVYILDTGALYNLEKRKRVSPIKSILDDAPIVNRRAPNRFLQKIHRRLISKLRHFLLVRI
jgi:hypothetical protein